MVAINRFAATKLQSFAHTMIKNVRFYRKKCSQLLFFIYKRAMATPFHETVMYLKAARIYSKNVCVVAALLSLTTLVEMVNVGSPSA